MRWRRVGAIMGLVGLTVMMGGCPDQGTGVVGPVPKETSPVKSDGDRPAAKDKTSDWPRRLGASFRVA
jgi:hypothetical protein